mgnify:CR=1 FL=1
MNVCSLNGNNISCQKAFYKICKVSHSWKFQICIIPSYCPIQYQLCLQMKKKQRKLSQYSKCVKYVHVIWKICWQVKLNWFPSCVLLSTTLIDQPIGCAFTTSHTSECLYAVRAHSLSSLRIKSRISMKKPFTILDAKRGNGLNPDRKSLKLVGLYKEVCSTTLEKKNYQVLVCGDNFKLEKLVLIW